MKLSGVIRDVAAALLAAVSAFVSAGGAAQGQGPSPVQPWGLPPLPAGIGAVEKFADVSGTPQGQFLEGGAFDTQGNLWFVAIGSGWVSYLTPDGKLVPVFNCNPPPELGQTCEPRGTRWFEGKLYLTSRHRGILVFDPRPKRSRRWPIPTGTNCSKAPTISTSMPRAICSSPILGALAPAPT